MENIVQFPTPAERTARAVSAAETTTLPPEDMPMASPLLWHLHSLALFDLPFVTLPAMEFTSWRDFWKHTVMWNDEPTDNRCDDYQRGRRYAREAVAAIVKDGAQPRSLQIVVKTILERAFRRRGPRGGLCRHSHRPRKAFLNELVDIAVAGARHLECAPSTDFR
jgi:hypothetical protein